MFYFPKYFVVLRKFKNVVILVTLQNHLSPKGVILKTGLRARLFTGGNG